MPGVVTRYVNAAVRGVCAGVGSICNTKNTIGVRLLRKAAASPSGVSSASVGSMVRPWPPEGFHAFYSIATLDDIS